MQPKKIYKGKKIMSTLIMNPKDGQCRWPYSAYSRVKKANLDEAVQHVCMRIPREAFRQSGMCFDEVRQSSQVARYWEMMMQLFLEMCRNVNDATEEAETADKINIYPYQKVYLEWIPSENDPQRACEYRLHSFLLTDVINYGHYLNIILSTNDNLRSEAVKRPSNSRKPDPLCALSDHQHYKRVTKEVYFRNICGLACGHRRVENNLDQVMSHGTWIGKPGNIANPINIWTVEHACANCKNPDFKDREELYINDVFTFQNANRVIRLSPEQLFTKVFSTKFLPDYQAFIDSHIKPTKHVALPPDLVKKNTLITDSTVNEAGKDQAERPDDDRLDLMTLGEYDMRTVTEQEKERIEAFSSRSDFQNLSISAKDMYIGNCEEHEGKPEFQKNYYNYQQWAMKELKSRCLNPDANISEKGKTILRWAQERNPPEYKTLRKYNHDLSLFANRVIKIMEEAEQLFLISTAHREYYQVMHARLDAYRRNFGLHLNIFQTGEGATSKSFLFDLMKDGSIVGSIDQLTYETAKANAVDGNRNDTITVCHEAPPGMFRASKNKNMDSGMEAMFKERLTSNHVSCKTFYMDEATGKRSQRVTKSECIGVWMGATNDDPDDVEEALKTRFYWGNFEKQKRPDKDIDDCINGERSLSREDKIRKTKALDEWKEEQYRVFLIEKMIWTNVIKDVEMSAFYVLKQRFKKKYHGESVRDAETRDWERIYIFARIQAICTALAAVFQVEGGEYYGMPFDEEQMLAVEPYLVVTEEMVFFTMTLMDGQFVHPAEHKILNKIYHTNKKKKTGRFGIPRPEDDSSGISYDYLKLGGNLASNAKLLHSHFSAAEGKTSLHNIQAFLSALSRVAIKTYHYAAPPDPEDDKLPEWPKPITHTSNGKAKEKHLAQCAHFTADAIYIHMSLLLSHAGNFHDPVLDTIQNIKHKYQTPKDIMVARRFYANTTNGKKVLKYRVFNIIKRLPDDKTTIKYRNVLYNSSVSKSILGMGNDDETRKKKEIEITEDIDTYAYRKREYSIGRPIRSYEERGINDNNPSINYPYCMHETSVVDSMAGLRSLAHNNNVDKAVGKKRPLIPDDNASKRLKTY